MFSGNENTPPLSGQGYKELLAATGGLKAAGCWFEDLVCGLSKSAVSRENVATVSARWTVNTEGLKLSKSPLLDIIG